MLRTLGRLELDGESYNRPVPLLLLAYLSYEGGIHQRHRLAELFWPRTAALLEDAVSQASYPLYLLLEENWKATENEEVRLHYQEIARELKLVPGKTLVDVKVQLEETHSELKELGVIKAWTFLPKGSSGDLTLLYTLGKHFLASQDSSKTREHVGKRNLRGVLHKLEHDIQPNTIEKDAKWVRSLIEIDTKTLSHHLGRETLNEAKSLYQGHFLAGIETWLTETAFDLGSDLQAWITDTRKSLAKDTQLALLQAAVDEFLEGNEQRAGELALEVYSFYPDLLLNDEELRLILDLMVSGHHSAAKRVEQEIAIQGRAKSMSESSQAAQERTIRAKRANHGSPTLMIGETDTNRSHFPNKKYLYGSVPRSSVEHFVGRESELATVKSVANHPQTRVIHIGGRAGIGKTSLATRLILDWDSQPPSASRFYGINYTIFRKDQPYPLDTVIRFIKLTLSVDKAEALDRTWKARTSLQVKLDYLFQVTLRDHPILVVWDNLETILTDANTMPEASGDLQDFIKACLEYDHGLVLLTVSQRPINLPDELTGRLFEHHHEIILDKGLHPEASVALLHSLDRDGRLGFASVEAELLLELARRSYGMPRILQSVAGKLRKSPTLTLTDVLEDEAIFKRLQNDPVGEIYQGLSQSEKAVVQVLSVYGCGVSLSAVQFCLSNIDTGPILDDLIRSYVVKFSKESEGEYTLLEADRAYAYQQLYDERGKEAQQDLHRKAAEFYLQNPAHKPWSNIEDLRPSLRAFNHLVSAEAYDGACRVLLEMGFDYLYKWGHAELFTQMHKQLEGQVQDKRLTSEHLNALGLVYNAEGKAETAMTYFNKALLLSSEVGDAKLSEDIVGNLGLTCYQLKVYDLAVMYYQDGLRRIREMGRLEEEGDYLGMLALCYLDQGGLDKAASCFHEAIDASGKYGKTRALGIWYGSLAIIELQQGKLGEAEQYSRLGLNYCRKVSFRKGEASNLDNLGKIYLENGSIDTAIALWFVAYHLHIDTRSHYQHDVKQRLTELANTYKNFGATVAKLPSGGDALLTDATGQSYSFFGNEPQRLKTMLKDIRVG